jgi:hypothetical protein
MRDMMKSIEYLELSNVPRDSKDMGGTNVIPEGGGYL